MANIIKKIFREETPYTANHHLGAILRFWFQGVGGSGRPVTMTRIETMLTRRNGRNPDGSPVPYTLAANEKQQLDEWKAAYDALGVNAKQDHLATLESLLISAEAGAGTYITKAFFKSATGVVTDPAS